ncbi:MAG: hypothetical protein EA347_07075 [Thioalkalivibrio sp.]|nr:MAG: hypothetical protein EA347_07075 [Thioalkalivibrio sp.]
MVETPKASGFSHPAESRAVANVSRYRTPETLEAWLEAPWQEGLLAQFEASLEMVRALNELPVEEFDLPGLSLVCNRRVFPMLSILSAQMERLQGPVARGHQVLVTNFATLLKDLAGVHLRLVDLQQGRSPASAGWHLRRAAYLSQMLSVHLWRLYQAEPRGFWLQLHRALGLAERLGVASEPATDRERGAGYEPASVEAAVARVAVLASADIYALYRGEASALAQWLKAIPLRCTDTVASRNDQDRPMLRMLLSVDRPPSLQMGQDGPAPSVRYIELGPVIAALRFTPPAPVEGAVPQKAADSLDQRLRRRWVVPSMRQFRREPADRGPLVTVTGLKEIHTMIRADYRAPRLVTDVDSDMMPGAFFAEDSDDPSTIPSIFGVGVPGGGQEARPELNADSSEPREIQRLSPRKLQRVHAVWDSAVRGVDGRVPEYDEEGNEVLPNATVAWMKNVGAGGCCLLLQSPVDTIYSGNLIAIRLAEEERISWQLGVIRWLRYDDADTATVGVQYLTQACVPVDIHSTAPVEGVAGGTHPGLFFHKRGEHGVGCLLFAAGSLPAGVRVTFRIGGMGHNVMLKTVHPESHVYSRAEFSMHESASGRDQPAAM